jgi:hypothetical protein
MVVVQGHQPWFPPPQWVRRGADAVRYGLQGLIIIISHGGRGPILDLSSVSAALCVA